MSIGAEERKKSLGKGIKMFKKTDYNSLEKNRPSISVILPVYNSEKYLDQCIRSLISQSFRDAEFIFIDDGSTDNSLDIITKYQQMDDRIAVYSFSNENAGAARNRGLERARGKYVFFLDSDDFFESSLLKDSFEAAERTKAEVVIYGYKVYDDRKKQTELKMRNRKLPRSFQYGNLPPHIAERCRVVPWNKMFLLDYIRKNNIRFQSIKRCNDKVFVIVALSQAKQIVYFPKREVYYRINNANSLQGSRDRGRADYLLSTIELKSELKKRDLYSGNIKETYRKLAIRETISGLIPPYSYESLLEYFEFAKRHLVPDVFDDCSEFKEVEEIKNLFESPDLNTFLINRMALMENTMVDKNSLEHRIGAYAYKLIRFITSR